METIKNRVEYIIIEDELPAQRLMRNLLGELRPQWRETACLDSVETAVSWLNDNSHPQLIFLDIQLADGLGFQVLERAPVKSMIIFTTAYDEYALRAFKVNSIDYLLKPIKKDQLETALQKYERFSATPSPAPAHETIDMTALIQAVTTAKPQYRTRFLVSQGETFIPLPVTDVAFIFSRNRISSAITFQGKRHILDFTLDALDDQLNPDTFFRVNRGFMVHIDAVAKVHAFFNGKLILETNPPHEEKPTISREKSPRFKLWLDR